MSQIALIFCGLAEDNTISLRAKFKVWAAARFRDINEESFVSKGRFARKIKAACCAVRGFWQMKNSLKNILLTDMSTSKSLL